MRWKFIEKERTISWLGLGDDFRNWLGHGGMTCGCPDALRTAADHDGGGRRFWLLRSRAMQAIAALGLEQ